MIEIDIYMSQMLLINIVAFYINFNAEKKIIKMTKNVYI